VWVEVGSSDNSENDVGRLKLRVTHLHPDNPALSRIISQYRADNVPDEDIQLEVEDVSIGEIERKIRNS